MKIDIMKYLGAVALAFAAAAAFITSQPAHAKDIHVCANVGTNAGLVYDAVAKIAATAEAAPAEHQYTTAVALVTGLLEEIDEADISAEEKSLLSDGALFLVQHWGAPGLNRAAFQDVAVQVCTARYGVINDRNNV